jgi:dCMP deaminase
MSQRFNNFFMNIAEQTAKLSYAKRLHVGSVIIKDKNIISFGYNGTPTGWDNNCENIEYMDETAGGWLSSEEICEMWPLVDDDIDPDLGVARRYRLKTKPEVLHAETNAIAKLAKSTESGDGATMFITHAPCLDCAKLIYQSGISSVLYRNSYRDNAGIEFLQKSNVEVNKI